MNLHGIVASAIAAVNPLTTAVWYASSGYTIDGAGAQQPTYADPQTVLIQVQALQAEDLKQMDGLNIQGVKRKLYMNGRSNGVVRPTIKGGDKFTFEGQTWLVTLVLEYWPDWTSAAITLQND